MPADFGAFSLYCNTEIEKESIGQIDAWEIRLWNDHEFQANIHRPLEAILSAVYPNQPCQWGQTFLWKPMRIWKRSSFSCWMWGYLAVWLGHVSTHVLMSTTFLWGLKVLWRSSTLIRSPNIVLFFYTSGFFVYYPFLRRHFTTQSFAPKAKKNWHAARSGQSRKSYANTSMRPQPKYFLTTRGTCLLPFL